MDANVPVKQEGSKFYWNECNEIVAAVNSKQDKITSPAVSFATYALMKSFLLSLPPGDQTIRNINVISDEKNNSGNLTNYTWANSKLNWVATTPIDL